MKYFKDRNDGMIYKVVDNGDSQFKSYTGEWEDSIFTENDFTERHSTFQPCNVYGDVLLFAVGDSVTTPKGNGTVIEVDNENTLCYKVLLDAYDSVGWWHKEHVAPVAPVAPTVTAEATATTVETVEPVNDLVNHPDHYTDGGLEVIDILQAKLTPEQFKGFLLGNVLKYCFRFDKKNGIEDLNKAVWYMTKLQTLVEGGDC